MKFKEFQDHFGAAMAERDRLDAMVRREWDVGEGPYGQNLIATIFWTSYSNNLEGDDAKIMLGVGARSLGYGEVRLDHLSASQLRRIAAVKEYVARYMQNEIDELPLECPIEILQLR